MHKASDKRLIPCKRLGFEIASYGGGWSQKCPKSVIFYLNGSLFSRLRFVILTTEFRIFVILLVLFF